MHRMATVLAAAVTVAAATIAGAAPALAAHHADARPAHAAAAPPASYYLSLGDSLAVGIQPNAKGQDVETTQGYADQLYTALKPGNPTLKLTKLGCPGETTTSMINGGICTYSDKTQLAQAAAFLKAHAGHVQLVTIDIGANDLNQCVVLPTTAKIIACLEKVLPVTVKNLETIVGTLRATSKTVPIIGMTYYDPELAYYLRGTAAGRQLAQASVTLASQFGKDLRQVYTHFGVPVASMYQAFGTSQFKATDTLPALGKLPRDVALICSYTWECVASPVGPNEHANVLGYGLIADTFLKTYLNTVLAG
jgi:lysophospholipase L1-like esterase